MKRWGIFVFVKAVRVLIYLITDREVRRPSLNPAIAADQSLRTQHASLATVQPWRFL